MKTMKNRRSFIKSTASALTGVAGMGILSPTDSLNNIDEGIHIIGPKAGFSPHVGTLYSMMTWMRTIMLLTVKGLSVKELDYLHDPESNTIGAMLLHLAATERQYQLLTMDLDLDFKGSDAVNWDAGMRLGDKGRAQIKGHTLAYYLDILDTTRARTETAFQKLDDEWLFKEDPSGFQGEPTNNYCKWFHVCEHESNHNGQMKWIKSRLPQ